MSKLKDIREKKNMSQSQLAKLSGVNFRTIQDYEQDKRSINKARVQTLYALSWALGCKIEDLVEFEKGEKGNEH